MTQTTTPTALAADAAARLRELTGVEAHDTALVLGSGWLPAADALGETTAELRTTDLPGFAPPSVEGHAGKIRSVRAGDRNLLVFLGRTHFYEGRGVAAVVHGVRTAAAAGLGRRPDAVHDGGDALALVVVGAAQEHQQVPVARTDRADLAGVAGDRGGGEAGQVGRLDLGGGVAERVDGGQPARAEHEGDVVPFDAGQLGEAVGGLLGALVGRAGVVHRAEL